MKIKQIYGVYYSATGNTKKVIELVGEYMKEKLQLPITYLDFTLPQQRSITYQFTEEDFVLFGTPVYAGRIPNKLLPYIQTAFKGKDTLAAAIVTYGNRSYDHAVKETYQELSMHGFYVTAAAAVPAQHAFSARIATNRPDEEDEKELLQFAEKLATLLADGIDDHLNLTVCGDAQLSGYYTPLKEDGTPAVFLKAKPKTDMEKCINCKVCAQRCPMGSISFEQVDKVLGICIKCQACVKYCPTQAKYFDDKDFLSHVCMLEKNYRQQKSIAFWYLKDEVAHDHEAI